MHLSDIKIIGVLGAGTMGQGIAQACAVAGFKTLLYDVSENSVNAAVTNIRKAVQILFERGKVSIDQSKEINENILAISSLDEMSADLVIEAVIENLEIKQNLFKKLEQLSSSQTILATNTSSISVTAIATVLKNRSRFVGLHFFNPAQVMKLVEIIRGPETSDECFSLTREFAGKIGKIGVQATDTPGFIVNRVARHYYLESLKILEDEGATMEGIDALLKSAGFKMGPFELMDLIGIDVNYAVTLSTYKGFHQAHKFKPNRLQQMKVEAGHFGRKTGKGFYSYDLS
jgi:3-hydroxybutyryl-CoA dehydrogenase